MTDTHLARGLVAPVVIVVIVAVVIVSETCHYIQWRHTNPDCWLFSTTTWLFVGRVGLERKFLAGRGSGLE